MSYSSLSQIILMAGAPLKSLDGSRVTQKVDEATAECIAILYCVSGLATTLLRFQPHDAFHPLFLQEHSISDA